MIGVTENLRKIRDLLALTALEAGRQPGSVALLAVSKKQPVSAVLEAAENGQRDFGESFVAEGVEKMLASGRPDLNWHFIGHLQSNKTQAVAEHFSWLHTLDRVKTAERLSRQRPDELEDLNICLQINIDNEPGKSGLSGAQAADLAHAVIELPRLRLRGLMCLPMERQNFAAQRKPFAEIRLLSERLGREGISLDTLSMGMSGDYRAAIFEGATIVRLGTAVFGQRPS